MRLLLLVLAVSSTGCLTLSSHDVRARPALEVDGQRRPLHVTLDPSVGDEQTVSAEVDVVEWRRIVGQAFTTALKETFVVVNRGAPGVMTLRIKRASPKIVAIGYQRWGQVDYRATLEDSRGRVLARSAGVVTGPQPGSSALSTQVDATTSAVEELVRTVGAKLLAALPEDWEPSDEPSSGTWADGGRPGQL